MPFRATPPLLLRLQPDPAYAPLVQGVIDQAASLRGLTLDRRAALSEAGAKVFALLCECAPPESCCELRILPKLSCVEAELHCNVAHEHLDRFNRLESESGPLYGVDRARLAPTETGGLRISLRQEKEFGRVEPLPQNPAPAQPLRPPFDLLRAPFSDAHEPLLYELCLACRRRYPPYLLLSSFLQPAKFAAMLRGQELAAVIALDSRRQPAGLLCWERAGQHNAVFFGPYLFNDAHDAESRDTLAALLVEAFLNSIARSECVGAFSGLATPELPAAYFERLGEVRYWLGQDGQKTLSSWYKHLREDYGAVVWAHPELIDFLRRGYEELGFARELRPLPAPEQDDPLPEQGSLFAIDLRRELGEAVIRPLEPGRNLDRNLDQRLRSLRATGARNIFFHVDLAYRWQAGLTRMLLARGFAPCWLLPCAGRSDILVFHYDQDASV